LIKYTREDVCLASVNEIPALIQESADVLIALDTEWSLKVQRTPPCLGLSDMRLSQEEHRRKHHHNTPLSYQWLALDTKTGRHIRNLYFPHPGEPRLNLGDLVRFAVLDVGYTLENLKRREGKTPLKMLIAWHWGSAEVGLMADRQKLMAAENIVSLGGGVVTLEPGPLSIPMRDEHGNYGEVTLTLADTSRLLEAGASLEKVGDELGLLKIDIEAMGYDKSRMYILLEKDPDLFERYALRDCEITEQ
jgi:hypothetical protein